ncbi:hypothetical protein CEXT_291331 [Caerostris extrusa]|uniref:Endoplasmic reticulum transmembrane protein n=1 Tax=Caerostris extrusa TaxID=172846 RepID=A0AAV4W4C3_CAEEX|nr:hypothetical protein CEXT_291331 [Caerostris extrusa]
MWSILTYLEVEFTVLLEPLLCEERHQRPREYQYLLLRSFLTIVFPILTCYFKVLSQRYDIKNMEAVDRDHNKHFINHENSYPAEIRSSGRVQEEIEAKASFVTICRKQRQESK